MTKTCFLVLDDGSAYAGTSFGSSPPAPDQLEPGCVRSKAAGEVVFNTGMSGYSEILTDPSYTGQIVTMTYPHIGNYGTDEDWSETGPESETDSPCKIKVAGFVVRSLYRGPVPAGRMTLDDYLAKNQTPGITNVDTRALTLRMRDHGSPLGVIVDSSANAGNRISDRDKRLCVDYLKSFPGMVGRNLIDEVGISEIQVFNATGSPHIALLDCGIKANIMRELLSLGCKLSVLPSGAEAREILERKADAMLISNGPGDPGALDHQIGVIGELIGKTPVFGICLGHQLIGLALGGDRYKMKFGHHGVNHPVRDEQTKRVFVTSQNHGFALDEGSLPHDVAVWFRNANDQSNEGLIHKSLPIMSVQFHPESAPGPRDSVWIFKAFLDRLKTMHPAAVAKSAKEKQ